MANRIIQRHDTAANWSRYNPILAEGELGFVTDQSNRYKIGDGITAWNNLPLQGFNGNVVNELGNDEGSVLSQKFATEKLTELESETIYDVSANNDGATFASLSSLLSSENLSTLIPTVVRCGGMSIRFIQSSDNKYVQYRLMDDVWSVNTDNWSFCGDDVYVDNPEFISVEIDKDGRIIEGIRKDGRKVIKNSVEISRSLTVKKDLNIGEKVHLPTTDIMSIDNPEYFSVEIDKDGKIIEFLKKNGVKFFYNIISHQSKTDLLQVKEELNLSEIAAKKLRIVINKEKTVIVDKNGNGDFTSLIAACLDAQNYDKYTIYVNSGVYDIAQEYINMFGASYFDNYTDNYNGYVHGRIDAGLFLFPNVSMIGIGLVEITFNYTGSNNYVRNYFSIVNTTQNNIVKNLTLRTTMNNPTRYIIHDDFSGINGGGTNIFKGLILDGGNCSAIMGCGMGIANTYIVDNCLLIGNSNIPSISYHNCSHPDYNQAKNKLIINACKGVGKCVVITIGPSQEKTMCIVSNCEFTEITKEVSPYDTYGYDNMELIKFNNTETNV